MVCECGYKECDFEKCLRPSRNFIFTPKSGTKQREIIHVLLNGVRSINIDLLRSPREKLQELIDEVDCAIRIFLNEEKFNFRVTKVCTIRGRQPRTGRMRNNDWNLKKCDEIVLTSDKRYGKSSNGEVCYVSNLEKAFERLRVGDFIRIGSSIKVKVTKLALGKFVTCNVIAEGCLQSHQAVMLPEAEDESQKPTDDEIEDCAFAVRNGFDVIIVPSVKRPEYYHTIERMLKASGIKLVAHVEATEEQSVDKIIEHFYGVYIESLAPTELDDYIFEKARKGKKLIIKEGFSSEESSTDAADSFLLKPSRFAKTVAKLMKASSETRNSRSLDEKALELPNKPESRVIISITSVRSTVEEIASSQSAYPIILLTKCPSIAKLCQLWRNVHAMVYVDCGKPWDDQREEMVQIAALYGSDLKMFDAKDFCVSWFDSNLEIDNKH